MRIEDFKLACENKKPGYEMEIRILKRNQTDNEHYTPKEFINGLIMGNDGNLFDLDAATSIEADKYCKIANKILTKETDGLKSDWGNNSFVFLNPPFSPDLIIPFVKKFVKHDNGILLVSEKPSPLTKKLIEPNCTLMMKFRKRTRFITPEDFTDKHGLEYFIALYAFGYKAQRVLLKAKALGGLNKWDPYIQLPEQEIMNLLLNVKDKEP